MDGSGGGKPVSGATGPPIDIYQPPIVRRGFSSSFAEALIQPSVPTFGPFSADLGRLAGTWMPRPMPTQAKVSQKSSCVPNGNLRSSSRASAHQGAKEGK